MVSDHIIRKIHRTFLHHGFQYLQKLRHIGAVGSGNSCNIVEYSHRIVFLEYPAEFLGIHSIDLVYNKYSKEEAAKRIFATTDKAKGTLKELSDKEGYETFVVPDDVGGRFSVLTAVGLLPIAVAGINIDDLMLGAKEAQDSLCAESIDENMVLKYAAIRNCFYNKGTKLECFVSYVTIVINGNN